MQFKKIHLNFGTCSRILEPKYVASELDGQKMSDASEANEEDDMQEDDDGDEQIEDEEGMSATLLNLLAAHRKRVSRAKT